MPSRSQPSGGATTSSNKAVSAGQQRARGAGRGAPARQVTRRRRSIQWGAAAAIVLAIAGTIVTIRSNDEAADGAGWPRVGGDLHSLIAIGDALYVAGHDAAAVSRDGGRQWQQIKSLNGSDAMGWALTADAVLAGGHPGLYRSTDGAATFAKVTGVGDVPDAHGLGGFKNVVYLASPQAGLMASTDGGNSWEARNTQIGRTIMGTILVDPADPDRLIAPDMSQGLVTSTDAGRTWKLLGGPPAAIAAAWNPTDVRQIVAIGMNGSAFSGDGGVTWQQVNVPSGTRALTFDTAGHTLYAAALDGDEARVFRTTDRGTTWTPTA